MRKKKKLKSWIKLKISNLAPRRGQGEPRQIASRPSEGAGKKKGQSDLLIGKDDLCNVARHDKLLQMNWALLVR